MQDCVFNTPTDRTVFKNKILTALAIAAFTTTGTFAADAKKEDKAAAAAPAAAASAKKQSARVSSGLLAAQPMHRRSACRASCMALRISARRPPASAEAPGGQPQPQPVA